MTAACIIGTAALRRPRIKKCRKLEVKLPAADHGHGMLPQKLQLKTPGQFCEKTVQKPPGASLQIVFVLDLGR